MARRPLSIVPTSSNAVRRDVSLLVFVTVKPCILATFVERPGEMCQPAAPCLNRVRPIKRDRPRHRPKEPKSLIVTSTIRPSSNARPERKAISWTRD